MIERGERGKEIEVYREKAIATRRLADIKERYSESERKQKMTPTKPELK